MEVYLIRHTTPQIEKGICYGQSDIPLAESFPAETEKLIQHLPEPLDSVYASPMSRCHELARLIKGKQEVITDKRLLEMNFGDWEMKKWNELNQEALNKWMKDFVNEFTPGGENFIALNTRVNEFIDDLVQKSHKKTVVVTHAGVIRCFIARILEMPLNNAFKLPCDYSGITKIHLHNDNCLGRLEYLNRVPV